MKHCTLTHNSVTIKLEEILTNPLYKITGVREAVDVEGGLTIMYNDENNHLQLIIIGYTELGEWIEYDSKTKTKTN